MLRGHLRLKRFVLDKSSHPKQPLTQDFISTATGIDEAMVKIEKQEIVEHLSLKTVSCQLNSTLDLQD